MRPRGIWRAPVVIGVFASIAACGAPQSTRDVPGQTARTAAIARAVPLLQHSQEVWIGERDCSSCHHQVLGLIALELVRDSGLVIHEPRFEAQRASVFDNLNQSTVREELAIGKGFINGQVGISMELPRSRSSARSEAAGPTRLPTTSPASKHPMVDGLRIRTVPRSKTRRSPRPRGRFARCAC